MSPPGRRRYYIWPVRIALLVVCLSLPHGKLSLFFIFRSFGLLLLWALNLSRTRKSLNKAGEIYTATARESAGCRLLLLRLYGTLILRSLSQDNRLLRCKDKNYESLLNAPAGARSLSLCVLGLLFMAHSPASISLPACSISAGRRQSRELHLGGIACKCAKKQIPGSANRSLARYSLSLPPRDPRSGNRCTKAFLLHAQTV